MCNPLDQTVLEQSMALADGQYSAVELTRAYFRRIRQTEPSVGAYLTVTEEHALQAAAASDERRRKGCSLGSLDGIPFAVKDNICTAGIPTTCASRMLEGYRPPYDAAVIERLTAAGAVLLGKLNMDEFAMGSTTEHSALGQTRNPLELSRVPGGSSGGSAAAVAAKEASFTLGSDTGGSIRQPAAFCGLVGMKPTYGAVSRHGLIAFAPSLEQIGPLTSNIRDNAAVLRAILGHDRRDANSRGEAAARAWHGCPPIEQGVLGLRIGIPDGCLDGLRDGVEEAIQNAVAQYRRLGAVTVPIALPSLAYALSAYYIISCAEASSNLGRFDGIRYGYRAKHTESMEELYRRTRSEGFGSEVKRRILMGTFVLSEGYYDAYYKKALRVRSRILTELQQAFSVCDCILMPVTPGVAYPIGDGPANPLSLYPDDRYTVPANIAGLPSLSLPCGKGAHGLPVGLQLTGPAFSEPLLYRVGYALEQARKEEVRA